MVDLTRSGCNLCVQASERLVLPRCRDLVDKALYLKAAAGATGTTKFFGYQQGRTLHARQLFPLVGSLWFVGDVRCTHVQSFPRLNRDHELMVVSKGTVDFEDAVCSLGLRGEGGAPPLREASSARLHPLQGCALWGNDVPSRMGTRRRIRGAVSTEHARQHQGQGSDLRRRPLRDPH